MPTSLLFLPGPHKSSLLQQMSGNLQSVYSLVCSIFSGLHILWLSLCTVIKSFSVRVIKKEKKKLYSYGAITSSQKKERLHLSITQSNNTTCDWEISICYARTFAHWMALGHPRQLSLQQDSFDGNVCLPPVLMQDKSCGYNRLRKHSAFLQCILTVSFCYSGCSSGWNFSSDQEQRRNLFLLLQRLDFH